MVRGHTCHCLGKLYDALFLKDGWRNNWVNSPGTVRATLHDDNCTSKSKDTTFPYEVDVRFCEPIK